MGGEQGYNNNGSKETMKIQIAEVRSDVKHTKENVNEIKKSLKEMARDFKEGMDNLKKEISDDYITRKEVILMVDGVKEEVKPWRTFTYLMISLIVTGFFAAVGTVIYVSFK